MELGKILKMTAKTKINLTFYEIFNKIAQWFINHTDYTETNTWEWIHRHPNCRCQLEKITELE